MHHGRFQTRSAIWKFSVLENQLTSFLMLNVLEAKVFQYDFLEGRNM